MKRYHIIYKITNLTNDMYYVGAHSTINLTDDYMGSGPEIKKAIINEGKGNFRKDIISSHDTEEEMYAAERRIVDKAMVADKNTYNLTTGGRGSWPENAGINGRLKIEQLRENDPEWLKRKNKKLSEAGRRNKRALGYKHTKDAKRKISKVQKGREHTKEQNKNHSKTMKGNTHTRGRTWICHPQLKQTKVINSQNIPQYLTQGWIKGRKHTKLTIK